MTKINATKVLGLWSDDAIIFSPRAILSFREMSTHACKAVEGGLLILTRDEHLGDIVDSNGASSLWELPFGSVVIRYRLLADLVFVEDVIVVYDDDPLGPYDGGGHAVPIPVFIESEIRLDAQFIASKRIPGNEPKSHMVPLLHLLAVGKTDQAVTQLTDDYTHAGVVGPGITAQDAKLLSKRALTYTTEMYSQNGAPMGAVLCWADQYSPSGHTDGHPAYCVGIPSIAKIRPHLTPKNEKALR